MIFSITRCPNCGGIAIKRHDGPGYEKCFPDWEAIGLAAACAKSDLQDPYSVQLLDLLAERSVHPN